VTRTSGPFRVYRDKVEAARAVISSVVELSETVSMKVPAEDFPTWCQALGAGTFYATRTARGSSFVHTGHTVKSERFGEIYFSVTCERRPAPYVEPPMSEGSRTFRFTATETESTE
jgi:hypothetical protein